MNRSFSATSTKAGRLIAIGDIHGCSTALNNLLNSIQPTSADTIVTLGDYVNKGPDSRGVIDLLIDLDRYCNLVPLLGNHEQLLLHNRESRRQISAEQTTDLITGLDLFSDSHFKFMDSCRLYHESENHFFVHANYDPDLELADQNPREMLWLSVDAYLPKRHRSGKTAVVGHTSQKNGRILNRRHLICIDTYCYGGGCLTAIEVNSGKTWSSTQP